MPAVLISIWSSRFGKCRRPELIRLMVAFVDIGRTWLAFSVLGSRKWGKWTSGGAVLCSLGGHGVWFKLSIWIMWAKSGQQDVNRDQSEPSSETIRATHSFWSRRLPFRSTSRICSSAKSVRQTLSSSTAYIRSRLGQDRLTFCRVAVSGIWSASEYQSLIIKLTLVNSDKPYNFGTNISSSIHRSQRWWIG